MTTDPDAESTRCPNGKPGTQWRCRFCSTDLHKVGSDCGCSIHRKATLYAPLCLACAHNLDLLTEDSRLGRIHKALVRDSWFEGRGPSDDG